MQDLITQGDVRMENGTPQLEQMLKAQDVANLLNISKRTLWRRLSEGKMPPADWNDVRIKRWWRETIEGWIDGSNAQK